MSFGWTAYRPLSDPGPGAQPDAERPPELSDLSKLARRAVRGVVGAARADDRETFRSLLLEHLGPGLDDLQTVSESWANYDHVNVQAGLDVWLESREHRLVGVMAPHHMPFGMSDLLRPPAGGRFPQLRPGNVAQRNLPVGPGGEVRSCVEAGLYLVTERSSSTEIRLALLLQSGDAQRGRGGVSVTVLATEPGRAAATAAELRQLSVEHNVFRGQLLSFGASSFGERETLLSFHPRPGLTADDVILPAETLQDVARQVVGVARHRDRLLAAGQHLKRGLLLYGPPGVGKTHTVRFLASQLTGTTIIQLSGEGLSLISQACSVARTLQPAMVVVEDVDLIAEERGRAGPHGLLFQLLNEMDGLAEDADVVFLLTTNRADLLEPALAQRPGRIDQAVELRLPDAGARRRLIELYRGALEVDDIRLEVVLERTDGVTASFLKELLRRAAVRAVERGETLMRVSAEDLDEACEDLLSTRNAMTQTLLGGVPR